jgi:hypothetical protein
LQECLGEELLITEEFPSQETQFTLTWQMLLAPGPSICLEGKSDPSRLRSSPGSSFAFF